MRLLIPGVYSEHYINYIINYFKQICRAFVVPAKLRRFDAMLSEKFNIDISAYAFYLWSLNHIIYKQHANYLEICLDNMIEVGEYTKMITVCKSINYGSLNCRPYPIYTEVFNELEEKLGLIWFLYHMGK